MSTERRQQQRRQSDIHPCEALSIAIRHLIDVGGTDMAIVDGQLVRVTATVVTQEELREMARRESGS